MRLKYGIFGKNISINITLKGIILYSFMIALVGFTVLPLIYMISTAFKPMDELFIFPPRFLVRKPTLNNFYDLLIALSGTVIPFTRYLFNSLFTTLMVVTLTVIVSALGAFGLVKHKPKGGKIVMSLVISTLMFSSHVTQIPNYMIVNNFKMINTYWALIIPKIAVAYNFFLMERFMQQIPDAILESARMDGASEMFTFWKIVMPSLKPAWATLVVLSFISTWNDYFTPLIFTSSEAMKTVPLALQTIAGGPAGTNMGRAGAVGAASLLMTMPTIIIFTAMQAKVIETMVHSGIKE